MHVDVLAGLPHFHLATSFSFRKVADSTTKLQRFGLHTPAYVAGRCFKSKPQICSKQDWATKPGQQPDIFESLKNTYTGGNLWVVICEIPRLMPTMLRGQHPHTSGKTQPQNYSSRSLCFRLCLALRLLGRLLSILRRSCGSSWSSCWVLRVTLARAFLRRTTQQLVAMFTGQDLHTPEA